MTPSAAVGIGLARRILVTDVQDRPGIAAVRCLGNSPDHVTAGGLHRWAGGLWSRHCDVRAVLPDPREGLDAFANRLVARFSSAPQDIVIPGRDETLYALSACRERVGPHLALGLPEHAVVLRALDRRCLATAAASAGLPVPEQRLCRTYEEAAAVAAAFGWPVLVKPVMTAFERRGRVDRHASRWAADETALRTAVSDMAPCLVQRRVTGSVVSFGGVATASGLLGAVVSRYVRMWPPQGGHSSFTVSIAPPGDLEQRVAALVGAIGWTGIFELELIETPDGAMHAIDFNPRVYGSMALAAAAGVPLVRLWCDWLLGRAPAPARGRAGVRYRFDHGELFNALLAARQGRLRAAADVLRPRPGTVHSILRADDPGPALVSAAAFVGRRLRRLRTADGTIPH